MDKLDHTYTLPNGITTVTNEKDPIANDYLYFQKVVYFTI